MKRHFYCLPGFLAISGLFFTTAQAATYTLTPTADAYVEVFQPDTNFGSSSRLATNATFGGGAIQFTYLMFDLGAIPAGETITGATLNLYQVEGVGVGMNPVNASRVDDDSWNEMSITWNNKPDAGYLLGTNTDGALYQGWAQWDILSTGNWDAVADQTDGLLSIMLAEGPSGNNARQYCSKESDLDSCSALGATGIPFLEITTVPLPAAVWLFGFGLLGLIGIAKRKNAT
jgi:hypothetical protein